MKTELIIPSIKEGKTFDDIKSLKSDTIYIDTIGKGIGCVIANGKIYDTAGKVLRNKELNDSFASIINRANCAHLILFGFLRETLKDNPKLHTSLYALDVKLEEKITLIIQNCVFKLAQQIPFEARMKMMSNMFLIHSNCYVYGGFECKKSDMTTISRVIENNFEDSDIIMIKGSKGSFEKPDSVIYKKYSNLIKIDGFSDNLLLKKITKLVVTVNGLKEKIECEITDELRSLILSKKITKVLLGGFYEKNKHKKLNIIAYY